MDRKWLRWLYPNKCVVCSDILVDLEAPTICNKCESGNFLYHAHCTRCGKPFGKASMCLYCGEVPAQLAQVKSLFPYTGLYKMSLQRWKYRGIRKYAQAYGVMLAEAIRSSGNHIDCLVPIPVAPKRYKKRGFNQAYDLAKVIGECLEIPVLDLFERQDSRKPQSACSKEERHQNIKGKIQLKSTELSENIKYLAFVDDIYTTGSTAKECINAILKDNPKVQIEAFMIYTICMAI